MIIPYVKQADGARQCGAACLSMAYAALGSNVSQDEIWRRISKVNRFGSVASTSHLMAKDALERGFEAVIVQARQPLQALRICQQAGLLAILNHRLSAESPHGHYSLLAGIEGSTIVLHDPLAGPFRRLSFPELLGVWRKGIPESETMGYGLLGIAPRGTVVEAACATCKLEIPAAIACPKCRHDVPLRPAALLGCVAMSCGARLWSYVACPECDYTWAFHGEPAAGSAAEKPAPAAEVGMDVDRLYQELEKFLSLAKTTPGALDREDVRKQLDYVYGQKEVLRMALAEAAAGRQQRADEMEAMAAAGRAKKEAHNQRAEEARRQAEPLDGDALGMALLRNLGFLH